MRRKRFSGFFVSMKMRYLILIPTIFHLIITVLFFFFPERDDAPWIFGGRRETFKSLPA